jgi:ABC-type branched-subunit amino acid transport system substrate-binding protein
LRIALLHDDSDYGQQGERAMRQAFASNPHAVAARILLPVTASDLAPQILQARRAHASALLVWGEPATIAKALIAARSSGWRVPVYTPAAGEDPLVRQELADHPDWVDGLTFASGRMTAEVGPGPFRLFRSRLEAAYGPHRVGIRTRAGRQVFQPPDYGMYPYDFVNVLAAAIARAGSADKKKVLAALNEVSVRGANGDERGFNLKNHEGVVDDDVYFARFHDMIYRPVKDDPLSASLPVIGQTR